MPGATGGKALLGDLLALIGSVCAAFYLLLGRNLRRKLSAEGSSFQKVLDEVRYQLAREYLATSKMSLEEISVLLGYSTPGNFSHAFKRWHGSSPRKFRQVAR